MPFEKGITPDGAIPFKKGQSGNPLGKPAGVRNRTTVAREVLSTMINVPANIHETLSESYPELPKKMTIESIMTLVMAYEALKRGDVQAYRAIMDSAYGMPNQQIDSEINTNISVKEHKRVIEDYSDKVFKNEEPGEGI